MSKIAEADRTPFYDLLLYSEVDDYAVLEAALEEDESTDFLEPVEPVPTKKRRRS